MHPDFDNNREHLQYHLSSMFSVPEADPPPVRVWRDWVFLAAVLASTVAEAILREEVIWRWQSFVVAVLCSVGILYRRQHPFVVAVVPIVIFNIAEIASLIVNDGRSVGLYTSAYVLVLLYCVFRWGTGREMVYMVGLMIAAWFVSWFSIENTVGDVIAGLFVLAAPALGGLEVRHALQHRKRTLDMARSNEREQIARELHDSVAHHVSAIAIQAQAGLAISKEDPAAARDALMVVEEAAARTLDEMRSMVGALRAEGAEAELAPQSGVRDIERLGFTAPDGPEVRVELRGELNHLSPPIDSALFRLAQESITNANRHARNATVVSVCVEGRAEQVRMRVTDDGETATIPPKPGYGLLGMAERTKLLGGRFEAGPCDPRGWSVSVELPCEVPA